MGFKIIFSPALPIIGVLILMLHILGCIAALLSVMSPSPHVSADKAFATLLNEGDWSTNTIAIFGINSNAAAFLDVAVHVGHYPPWRRILQC